MQNQLAQENRPVKIGQVVSNLIDRHGNSRLFKPWDYTIPPSERSEYLLNLLQTIGPRHAHCSLENYVVYAGPAQQKVFDQVTEFSARLPDHIKRGAGIVLYGNPGTGKDHLMTALLSWAVARHGYTVEWHNGMELCCEFRDLVGRDTSAQALVKSLVRPLILAISDPIPPKGDLSRYGTECLYRVIDRRNRACKTTWATMNALSGNEAEEQLSPNIVDRLRHDALCLCCDWQSWRGRPVEEQ